jgi:hypothetical protein
MVPVERPMTNEKFASREKIRKWKTGIREGNLISPHGKAADELELNW